MRYYNLTKSFSKLQRIQNLIEGKKSLSEKEERMTKQKYGILTKRSSKLWVIKERMTKRLKWQNDKELKK